MITGVLANGIQLRRAVVQCRHELGGDGFSPFGQRDSGTSESGGEPGAPQQVRPRGTGTAGPSYDPPPGRRPMLKPQTRVLSAAQEAVAANSRDRGLVSPRRPQESRDSRCYLQGCRACNEAHDRIVRALKDIDPAGIESSAR